MSTSQAIRTAEHVSAGHPDKFCDQVADRILDRTLELAGGDDEVLSEVRTAIECLAKDNLLVVSGEMRATNAIMAELNPIELAREVWEKVRYGKDSDVLTVVDHIRAQSADIAKGAGTGIDAGGAGDQGIMVGYATDENPEMMPEDWLKARNLCLKMDELCESPQLPWLRADCKSQVSLDENDNVLSVIVAAQHSADVELDEVRAGILSHVVTPVLGDVDVARVSINGTGKFVIGGPIGDAGVVGRKIVVDAYGPAVPVGGGAYSGKDPTKVDRSAAYMARHIAKTVVGQQIGDAKKCTVHVAYGIGRLQPEMIYAVTDAGKDVSSWVREKFSLAPRDIIDYLGLRHQSGWSYLESAAYGHYGRDVFPWEKIADV